MQHIHPGWSILQQTIYLSFGGVFLWLNASNFDKTEIKTLMEMAGVVIAGEVVKNKLTSGHKEKT